MIHRQAIWTSSLLVIVAACAGDSVTAPIDPDPDGDGILSTADACPNQPETVNNVFDLDGCPDTPAEFYGAIRTDVETYWEAVFGQRQWTYSPISAFTPYSNPITTPCGDIPIRNAVYCGLNAGVYYHAPFMDELLADIGDAAPAFVVAHELGHHIGFGHLGWFAGATLTPKESELGADCFAGAWLDWVNDRGMLEAGDVQELTETMLVIGDPADTWFDTSLHGTAQQRTVAMVSGLTSGPWACLPNPGAVSGWVFSDANGNGVWDSSEGVWQNAPVDVTTHWDETVRVFTDANGLWTAEVPIGFAVADIDESAFPAGVGRTFGTDPDTVLVATGLTTFAGNDGFYLPPPGPSTQSRGAARIVFPTLRPTVLDGVPAGMEADWRLRAKLPMRRTGSWSTLPPSS